MSRDPELYLDDIRESGERIARYVEGMDFDSFAGDTKTVDAVIRNLEVIGEAVKNLPDDIRARHPTIEWRRIAGLRDMLIHAYFGVDLEIVWDVATNKVPDLRARLRNTGTT